MAIPRPRAIPRQRAGEWVGLLTVLGAPSFHWFGVLPMRPAFLRIRRELHSPLLRSSAR